MNDVLTGIRSVLIAEDSEVQRAYLAQLCRAIGIQAVHEAGNGREALALLDALAEPPDAMIIDLLMPVMDGIELIQQLQQRTDAAPFVIVSARDSALVASVLEMLRASGQDCGHALEKPASAASLARALERCVAARKSRHGAAVRARREVSAAELGRALREGAIVPHFQPKIDCGSGQLRGVEVLARWFDAEGRSLPPDQFVPVAEASGLIHPLTLSMLEQALSQALSWKARGMQIPLAVNLSPRLLELPTLVDDIGRLVRRYGLQPPELTFEITESGVISRLGTALGTLVRLRMRGFGLSIDDYGTGYSSMQQLSRIPFTELKIDKSFINGAYANERLRVILQSAIDMTQRLGLACVAEGVETAEDWALLRRAGCDLAQGWFFGRAMPGDELPAWRVQHEARLDELCATHPTALSRGHEGSTLSDRACAGRPC
ncbi:EAL domain-containing response regulator [Roseateles sp.]|uniref:EAL domain-containing response regulator n=1 Tax=Roseateles sp. TaxID=1971397 RepID=UPI0025F6A614|nr:EAL domain-containing response regulator [Roseateles sp.]MBV8035902.1 EAL domain-containing response regulator [Roseateles sp.]